MASSHKTGRLSKVEKFYIRENPQLDLQTLAKDLSRSQSIIKNYRNRLPKRIRDKIKPKESDTLVSQQFAKHAGSVVMTQDASSSVDDKREKKKFNNSQKKYVTEIRRKNDD